MTEEQLFKAQEIGVKIRRLKDELFSLNQAMKIKPNPTLSDIVYVYEYTKSDVMKRIRDEAIVIVDKRRDEIEKEIKILEKIFSEI